MNGDVHGEATGTSMEARRRADLEVRAINALSELDHYGDGQDGPEGGVADRQIPDTPQLAVAAREYRREQARKIRRMEQTIVNGIAIVAQDPEIGSRNVYLEAPAQARQLPRLVPSCGLQSSRSRLNPGSHIQRAVSRLELAEQRGHHPDLTPPRGIRSSAEVLAALSRFPRDSNLERLSRSEKNLEVMKCKLEARKRFPHRRGVSEENQKQVDLFLNRRLRTMEKMLKRLRYVIFSLHLIASGKCRRFLLKLPHQIRNVFGF